MRVVTVLAVLLVAVIAAVVSYVHMASLAREAGEGWRSGLLPLSVDGLVVAASMVLFTRRRTGLPGGRLAWAALLGGVAASLTANVAAAEPTVIARVIAAWPALAFAVAIELLLQQRRVSASVVSVPVDVVSGAVLPEPEVDEAPRPPKAPAPVELASVRVLRPDPPEPVTPAPTKTVSTSGTFSDVEFARMVEIARPLVTSRAGRTTVTKALEEEFDRPVSEYWSRKAIGYIRNNPELTEVTR